MRPEDFRQGLKTLGWKQSDFAQATGITQVSVSNWMTGTSPLPLWAANYLQLLLDLQAMSARLLTPPTRAARAAKRLQDEQA